MERLFLILFTFITFLNLSCSSDSTSGGGSNTDITDLIFTNTSGACNDYTGSFSSTVTDIGNDDTFNGSLTISSSASACTFSSNGIPNHDFNDANSFATDAAAVTQTYSTPISPSEAASTTALSLTYDNAIFLNGAKLDLLPAACYGVGPDPLGDEKIGCNDDSQAWRYDPMFAGNDFGTDAHNAHTQPDGTYHYHGNPLAMFTQASPTAASPVIGFAADGFPVYGPYIDDNGTIREVTSGYTLKAGARTNLPNQAMLPPGNYDGTFRDDYEYTAAGDLDECNGMTVDGQYGYYVTNAFPWVMNCFKGTPDSSFEK